MALSLKRVLIFIFIGGMGLLAFNWLAISVHHDSNISEVGAGFIFISCTKIDSPILIYK